MHSSAFSSTLRKFYVHVFSYDFIFGYAIFPAYFQLKGAAPGTIGLLLTAWAAGIMCLEIPSGLLSDSVDRRKLLALAPLLKLTCFFIWSIADGRIWMFFVGIFCWSLASAFSSGTREAILFEQAEKHNMKHRYISALTWERNCGDAATMLGAAIGGFVASYNLELSFWLSGIPLTISSFAALSLPKALPQMTQKTDHFRIKISYFLRSTWRDFFQYPKLQSITIYTILGVTLLGTLEDIDQLFYLAVKLPIWSFGLIAFGIGISRFIATIFTEKIGSFPAVSWILPLICGASFLFSGIIGSNIAIFTLAISYIISAPLHVLAMNQFQKNLQGDSRATTTSFLSVFTEGMTVVFNLIIAFLLLKFSIFQTYQICGMYFIAFALWELYAWQNKRALLQDYES